MLCMKYRERKRRRGQERKNKIKTNIEVKMNADKRYVEEKRDR